MRQSTNRKEFFYGWHFLRYRFAKLKNLRTLRRSDLWPLITGSNIDKGLKNALQITSPREQSAVFLLSSRSLSFEIRGGSYHPTPTPTLPDRAMNKAVPGRGLKELDEACQWTDHRASLHSKIMGCFSIVMNAVMVYNNFLLPQLSDSEIG